MCIRDRIVAPMSTGSSNLHYKTSNTSSSGTTSTYDGAANSTAINNSSHPAAQFCEALSIGGFTDWYLPARYELDIAYYNCKPTTPTNNTSFGVNDYSVPKYTVNRTNQFPLESIDERFRINGGENFDQDYYWSSTSTLSGTAVAVGFYNGYTYEKDKNAGSYVRAFRKVAINDSSLDDYRVIGEGGLVWMRCRTNIENNILVDTERGVNKGLVSNSITSGYNNVNLLPSFNPDGFITKQNGATNSGGQDYVSWTFRKQKGFFDIVTWNASSLPSDYLVAHNLGSVPGMIICKNLSNNSTDWQVYHRSATSSSSTDPNAHFLQLNKPYQATYSSGMASASGGWAVSSTHFRAVPSLGLDNGSDNFIAYVFAHDEASFGTGENESIIKCGIMDQGIGLYDIGFEPQFMLAKPAGSSGDWALFDDIRGFGREGISGAQNLFANTTAIEASVYGVDPTSSGFNNRSYATSNKAIYMAIRRPHKPPESGTEVFAVDKGGNNPGVPTFTSGFPIDFAFNRPNYGQGGAQVGYYPMAVTRLQGDRKIYTSGYNSEVQDSNVLFDSNTGYAKGFSTADIAWMFKRAPGFMDVTTYNGATNPNYAVQNIPHSLNAVPEMYITKGRNFSDNWMVYHKDIGNNKQFFLQHNGKPGNNPDCWNSTSPTDSVFTVGNDAATNRPGTYIAYLFASLPGISKVGSYTGTSTNGAFVVSLGFLPRFLLVRAISENNRDWIIFDSQRDFRVGSTSAKGIALNNTNSESTQGETDGVRATTTGFVVVGSSATTNVNELNKEYIYLAIA